MLLTILNLNSRRYMRPMMLQRCSKITSPFASNASPLAVICAKYATCKKDDKSSYEYSIYKPCHWPDHDLKNMALGRPMSPHLTIYGPTWPAVLSIAQRITGVVLTGYAVLLCIGALFLPDGLDSFCNYIECLDISSTLAFILKFLLAFPFIYHMINGIRFTMWNLGKWLAISHVYTTGKIALLASVILSILLAYQ